MSKILKSQINYRHNLPVLIKTFEKLPLNRNFWKGDFSKLKNEKHAAPAQACCSRVFRKSQEIFNIKLRLHDQFNLF